MLDIARQVQDRLGYLSDEAVDMIASEMSVPRVEIESCVSFYSFFSRKPQGEIVIRVCDDVPDRMAGYHRVIFAFRDELGIDMGETTPDGRFTLERTACIGMSDQGPAALIDDVVVTELSSDRAREIVAELRNHMKPRLLIKKLGDGNNAHRLVQAMVRNNIQQAGKLLFSPDARGEAIRKALHMSPVEVIRAIKTARLRGRGGAGFPAGMKWEFTRAAEGDRKFVICNADEGEPGTFKDRVLLTERADRVFAGMTIAAYAIGAAEGILYLRAEYAYLLRFLEAALEQRREDNLLGASILGHEGFDFDIRIQLGAGAYVCGEESALINSCEGKRGDPRNRPPFPAQRGYLDCPTVVNNVETLCCVTKILEQGPATFCEYGSPQSTGTKLLSIAGDIRSPGVYEVPFGVSLAEVLEMSGAVDAAAVQVGGPSGQLVGPPDFGRSICFDDLATGGSMIVFGGQRNLLKAMHGFMEFFVDESCGYCAPCRVGNVLLRDLLRRVLDGRGSPADLEMLENLGHTVGRTSRCGLGQTSPNPILSSLRNFRSLYDNLVAEDPDGFQRSFELDRAVAPIERIVGRTSVHAGSEETAETGR
jgi:[NiFe] hydrogenase diaphorase moiety large subunit